MINGTRQTGVTLIELLMAIAIIAVITSIAIPMYSNYITTARMTDADNELSAIRLAQEEFYLENNTYFGPIANDATGANIQAASNNLYTPSTQGYTNFSYSIAAGACGDIANCYTLTATGKAGTPVDGKTRTLSGP